MAQVRCHRASGVVGITLILRAQVAIKIPIASTGAKGKSLLHLSRSADSSPVLVVTTPLACVSCGQVLAGVRSQADTIGER